ncbi:MAG: VRR-NUC domain-containing protein [Candidatus Methanofastidiosum sp.]|nr:VRR-NUC domain-containing protein [Methanofastidiosum sp.]
MKKEKQKKYKREEQNLVKAVLEYLYYKGFIAIRNNSGVIFIGNGERKRAIRVGLSGSADIIACSPKGNFVAIECKSKKGKLTNKQKEFLDKVKTLGGVALIVRSLDDVINYFE